MGGTEVPVEFLAELQGFGFEFVIGLVVGRLVPEAVDDGGVTAVFKFALEAVNLACAQVE